MGPLWTGLQKAEFCVVIKNKKKDKVKRKKKNLLKNEKYLEMCTEYVLLD